MGRDVDGRTRWALRPGKSNGRAQPLASLVIQASERPGAALFAPILLFLLGASSSQDALEAVIALVTRVLIERTHRVPDPGRGPRSRPRRLIGNRELVVELVRSDAAPTFDQMQVFAGSLEVRLVAEIRGLDNQRAALPMTTRVPQPLADLLVEMRTPVQQDDASLVHLFLQNGHVSRSLHDLIIVVVASRDPRQRGAYDTTLIQAAVL